MSTLRGIVAAAAALVVSAVSAGARAQPPEAPEETPQEAPEETPQDAGLTTSTWREPGPPLDLHWHLLALPEHVVELAFAPAALALTAFERYRLDKRLYDLLRNDAGTVVLTPDVKIAGGEGFGAGGTLSFDRVAGGELDVGALGRLNGDFELESEYERSLVSLEGRILLLTAAAERDQNERWFGLGMNATEEDKRVMESRHGEVNAAIDLTRKGVLYLTGLLQLGYHYEALSAGSDPDHPGVGDDPMDPVTPPPDFDQTLHYGELDAILFYDTRDVIGRPTRGMLTEARVSLTQEVTGADFSAMSGHGSIQAFVPVLPDKRVLVFTGGVRVAVPFQQDDDLPVHELTSLGRKTYLRGFSSDRFREQHGYWGSVEYRFPVYEYLNTGGAADAMIFVDTGRVGGNLEDLFSGRPRFAGGVGLRGGYDAGNFFQLELGYSTEGVVLGFSLGRNLL